MGENSTLRGAACPALGRTQWQGSPLLTAGPGAPYLGWRERRALSGVERGLVEQTVTAKGVDTWRTGTLLLCTALTQGERSTEIHGNQQVPRPRLAEHAPQQCARGS